ncbi:hypothetical protein JZO70_17745 [Enterococcus sp. 669A]|uniref:Uncharacterized protein n=1 Tax=Candidatus Enterococcus moelleringii TaxID=2815325 RepID=A0ABS3LEH3_9ENTE|nr:hypothetical protein [Enterococcus sp. 669A]MBO1308023.1 hypothetical protein [Enterococcus sp. 669A]
MPNPDFGNLIIVIGSLLFLLFPIFLILLNYFVVKRAVVKGMQKYHRMTETQEDDE